jgi:lysophospholipase
MFSVSSLSQLWLTTLLLILFARTSSATPKYPRADAGYAPVAAQCPSQSLVRAATSISQQEADYVALRKLTASKALRSWLSGTGLTFDTTKLPTLALANSGGGYRAMLSGAGVVQALDGADSQGSTSGLYQALTYHAGLSGGSWLLSSLIGSTGDTKVSTLEKELWAPALAKNDIFPTNILFAKEGPQIRTDLEAKQKAGFDPSITDTWGRFLSYQLLRGTDGGVATRLSDVPELKNFQSAAIPFPIITALGKAGGISGSSCDPPDNAPQFEFTPFETGSWDSGIAAFTPTSYLGTEVSNGSPVDGKCYQNFDNLGYVLGASSSKFEESCGLTEINAIGVFLQLFTPLASAEVSASVTGQDPARRNLYAPFKNPFYHSSASSLVAGDKELYLVDGGAGEDPNKLSQGTTTNAKQRTKTILSGHSFNRIAMSMLSWSTTIQETQTTCGQMAQRSCTHINKLNRTDLRRCLQYPHHQTSSTRSSTSKPYS